VNWNEIVDKVTPFIVKIETPEGHGTGFLCMYNDGKSMCGIATAHHVIAHADRWEEPIRITHFPSGSNSLVKQPDRVIFPDENTDSAVILVPMGALKLPEDLIPLRPIENRLPIGAEVGWLGFPALGSGSNTLCFFSGNVSAWQDHRRAYLVDGVSINGISGGPVVYSLPDDSLQIVGAVSAYIVNRATGEALPGLSVAQDVSHFHTITRHIQSVDEGLRQKRAAEQAAQNKQAEPPTESKAL
jgi:Trypsin-like peptidase domain